METMIPVKLTGRSLGDRHHNLNKLVHNSYQEGVNFDSIKDLPEISPVDRLFKIDLASKFRLVDYIILSLKDKDMLYVSRALKCKWLLEPQYSHIINPTYLEERLFPEMLTTASNKMLHFIQMNLSEAHRCEEFYAFYVTRKFTYAFNFLWHCSNEFVFNEAQKVVDRLTPHQLKVLVEKIPQFSKVYFESLDTNESLLKMYLSKESDYYKSIICVLKSKPDIFLDITERYFHINTHKRLSPSATEFIMRHHKNRFMNKCQLYCSWFLDLKTVAKFSSTEEAKHIVLHLARAQYIRHWFTYENIAPLIKRIKPEDRAAFKKKVFVEKSVGELEENWPYPPPSPPELKQDEIVISFFSDIKYTPFECFSDELESCKFRCMIKKRKMCNWKSSCKSELDKLFDRFRFMGFSKTFFELRKEIVAQSSADIRMKMMLVLVSKSAGCEEHVKQLLGLLTERHINEPAQIRAAVVRSLVKRAAAWRLQPLNWELFVQFAQGLGIDGGRAEVQCIEGLHALILRHLLSNQPCPAPVLEAYLNEFSTLNEYSLNAEERNIIIQRLPKLLWTTVEDATEINDTANLIMKLLDVFDAYKFRNEKVSIIIPAVKKLAQRDQDVAAGILLRLYNAKVARKELIRENFNLIQTDASYLNALRHDPELITRDKFGMLVRKNHLDGFLQKVNVYFSEHDGLATQLLESLNEEIVKKPCVFLSRPLARLVGSSLCQRLEEFNKKPKGSVEKKMAYALKINSHVTRPKLDLKQLGWRQAGLKVVDNIASVCSTVDVPKYIDLLCGWPRAAKLTLNLAMRAGSLISVFKIVTKVNPIVPLTYLLKGKLRNHYDMLMWESIKNEIVQLDLAKYKHLRRTFVDIQNLPIDIQGEYISIMFLGLAKISLNDALPILSLIENKVPELKDEFIFENIVNYFINTELTLGNITKDDNFTRKKMFLFVRIIARYLLVAISLEEQNDKMTAVGEQFIEKVTQFWVAGDTTSRENIIKLVQHFLLSLKYSEAFLNLKYVSCLPVLQKVSSWIQEVFPINNYFIENFQINLLIAYYTSVRKCVVEKPELFTERTRSEDDAVQAVGQVFGTTIAKIIYQLNVKESISIINIYSDAIIKFFDDFFCSSGRLNMFIISVVKGIVVFSQSSQAIILAERIYRTKSFMFPDEEILELMFKTEDENVLGYLNANAYYCNDLLT